MTEQNPYTAPTASAPLSTDPPRRWKVGVLTLIVLHIALSCLYAPAALDLFQYGYINVITFLPAALAVLSLAVSGMLLLADSRAAAYLFGISGLLGNL